MKRKTILIVLLSTLIPLAACLFYPTASSKYAITPDEKLTAGKKAYLDEKAPQDTSRKPNVIIIIADDLGKYDLSVYGGKLVKTPYIDSIGLQGAVCTEGYVTSPICSPSRAALMTGRYQQRFGHEFQPKGRYIRNRFEYYMFKIFMQKDGWIPNDAMEFPSEEDIHKQGLPLSEITLPEMLKKYGYATAITGKWHLGEQPDFVPRKRGFDYHYGIYEAYTLYADPADKNVVSHHCAEFSDQMMWKSGRKGPHAIRRDDEIIEEKAYLTDEIAREAVQFIDKNKSKPFFLYASFTAPHVPLQVTKKYYDQFAHIKEEPTRVYYAMIAALDDAVGQITQKIKQEGLEDNTIIFFVSDNGGATYLKFMTNDPLKGGKFSNFEGGLNVPFLVKWKGKIPAGTVYKQPVALFDMFTTAAAGAKIGLPTDRTYDGVDLVPFLSQKVTKVPHPVLYWRSGYNKAVRTDKWKLIVNARTNEKILYNIAEDKYEKFDLLNKNPEQVKELEDLHAQWEKTLKNPLWPGIMNLHFNIDGKTYIFEI